MDAALSAHACPEPDLILSTCVRHLRAEAKRVAMASLGAACEQWLNTELFICLNFSADPCFPEGLWARSEHNKIDIAIVQGATPPLKVCGYIESKVVYPNGAHTGPILTLADQLRRRVSDEVLNVPRLGFVFSCWSNYYRIGASEFQSAVSKSIGTVFAASDARIDDPLTITDGSTVKWMADEVACEVVLHPIIVLPR
jgi:hypothetical protein